MARVLVLKWALHNTVSGKLNSKAAVSYTHKYCIRREAKAALYPGRSRALSLLWGEQKVENYLGMFLGGGGVFLELRLSMVGSSLIKSLKKRTHISSYIEIIDT